MRLSPLPFVTRVAMLPRQWQWVYKRSGDIKDHLKTVTIMMMEKAILTSTRLKRALIASPRCTAYVQGRSRGVFLSGLPDRQILSSLYYQNF